MQSNKDMGGADRWMTRAVRYLREWPQRRGRRVREQVLRGASYGVGSGAVSLLIIWFESRH